MQQPCLPCRATILVASSGNGRCKTFALSHSARIQTSRSSSVIRIADFAFGCIARRWRSAVEGRSQTNVRERLSAAPRSENIVVLRSTAGSQRATAGAAAGKAGAGEAYGTAARLGGRTRRMISALLIVAR
jgi:hypothetical protein